MARARSVPGIRPGRSLVDNARRVLEARTLEMLSWRQALTNPSAVPELHDLRIAAKRLRYALDVFAPCFPGADPARKALAALQTALGDIRDLEALVEMLRLRLDRVEDAARHKAIAETQGNMTPAERGDSLRRILASQARDRERLGLLALLAEKMGRRDQLYAALQERWTVEALEALSERVRAICALEPHSSVEMSENDAGAITPATR